MSRQSAKPRVSPFLVTVISLAILFGIGEIVIRVYLTRKEGRLTPIFDKIRSEQNAYVEDFIALGKNGITYNSTLAPHPYLAFVHHPESFSAVNSSGLLNRDFPLRKIPGEFVILVTGGSCAGQLVGKWPRMNWLEKELNAHYTNDTIKKFTVLNGGGGGWHQPQAFILFSLYADVIDGVITLDGFNEHYLLTSSLSFESLSPNYMAALNNHAQNGMVQWPLKIDGGLYQFEKNTPLVRHSYFLYWILQRIRSVARNFYSYVNDNSFTGRAIKSYFRLPEGLSDTDKKNLAIEKYKKYISMMHAIAVSMGIKDAYFIQPVPALNKTLTPQEKIAAGDLSYKDDYVLMNSGLLKLREKNIPVHSLLPVFENENDTIYKDWAHYNDHGYQMVAEDILGVIEKEWGLKRR